MKQILFSCLVSISLFSCKQSPEDKIKTEAKKLVEEKLLPTLKDPKSFEFSDIKIDTLTENDNAVENAKRELEFQKSLMELSEQYMYTDVIANQKYQAAQKEVEKNKKIIDSLKNVKSDKIWRLEITETYRAKNGFGALDVYKAKVYYVPSENKYTYIGE